MRVTVVGAGVVGLVTAIRLREAGHRVDLVAADPPAQTTSAIAAALWYPYRALPQADVTRWSAHSYQVLVDLAQVPASGVRLLWGRELFRSPTADPWWRSAVPALDRIDPSALPAGYGDGWRLRVPVADMPRHLAWLEGRLSELDIELRLDRIETLADLPDTDVVVNCTGLGARTLVADEQLAPVRGQVVVVEQFGLDEWLLDQSDPRQLTYVVPRQDTVILGGTADEDVEDLTPRPAVAQAIVERCAALVPAAGRARILAHRVGLRPARPSVRLELEQPPNGRRVVHCYGHGGAGVTLSHGCAQDIVELVDSLR